MALQAKDRVWYECRDLNGEDEGAGTVSHVEEVEGDLYAFVVWDDGTSPCWMPAEELSPLED